jgi:phage-related tail fiber protein
LLATIIQFVPLLTNVAHLPAVAAKIAVPAEPPAIGTTFGVGDDSTTFALPDLRGEFLRGWDNARGVDGSRVFGTTQTDAMQGHFHNFGQRNNVNGAGGGSYPWGVSEGGPNYATGSPITDGTNGTPRTAAETRPRNVALLICIRYI